MRAQAWRNRNGCWLVGCWPLVRTSSCEYTGTDSLGLARARSVLTTKPGSGKEVVSPFRWTLPLPRLLAGSGSGPEGWCPKVGPERASAWLFRHWARASHSSRIADGFRADLGGGQGSCGRRSQNAQRRSDQRLGLCRNWLASQPRHHWLNRAFRKAHRAQCRSDLAEHLRRRRRLG